MRIVLATTQVPFIRGGAELLVENLNSAIISAGHQCETVSIPFKWYPPEKILDHMFASSLLDISEFNSLSVDLMIGLKFPAYMIPHDKKVMWLVHQHRTAYEHWDTQYGDLINFPNGREVRNIIREADNKTIGELKNVYTISQNVSNRLKKYNNIDSKPLYSPPQSAEQFNCETPENYIFFPSRLNESKRQELAIKAMKYTKENIKLLIAGSADNSEFKTYLKQVAYQCNVQDRVTFLGSISEKEKIDYYARSLAVLYPPLDEDYGYITLEAMLSSKPVITCTDSGGPLEFIVNGDNGYITEPSSEQIAESIDKVASDRKKSREMGQINRERYLSMGISWDKVVEVLLK